VHGKIQRESHASLINNLEFSLVMPKRPSKRIWRKLIISEATKERKAKLETKRNGALEAKTYFRKQLAEQRAELENALPTRGRRHIMQRADAIIPRGTLKAIRQFSQDLGFYEVPLDERPGLLMKWHLYSATKKTLDAIDRSFAEVELKLKSPQSGGLVGIYRHATAGRRARKLVRAIRKKSAKS